MATLPRRPAVLALLSAPSGVPAACDPLAIAASMAAAPATSGVPPAQ